MVDSAALSLWRNLDSPLALLFVGGLVTFVSTALGAIPALGSRTLSDRSKGALIGTSAGIMLAAAAFTLIDPAFDRWITHGHGPQVAALLTGMAILLGAFLLEFLNRVIPHEHFETGVERGVRAKSIRRVWLFVLAITLHNFPEGLAVGSGVGSNTASIAWPILIGIGLQNIPEGFVVAFSLIAVGYRTRDALGVSLATGLVEALSALIGFAAVTYVEGFLPWALAMAGGAMICVVSSEMIPESHAKSQSAYTSAGLMIGFTIMYMIGASFS